MFNVMNLVKGELLANDKGDVYTWPTSTEALFVCNTYNEILAGGQKVLEIRKAIQNTEWHSREVEKFAKGIYTLPDFLKPYSEKHPHHFLHISKDKKALSYTKDELRGQQNSQTRISFDGYFEKYHSMVYRSERYALLKREWTKFVFGTDGLFFAKTKFEIKKVYTRYANKDGVATSCMRNSFDQYKAHPTEAYAAGDLQVAYMMDDEERTTARSVVWPEKMIYSRVYGETIIHDLLKARGYRQSAYYTNKKPDSFAGAKLLKIPHKGFFLMPYLDEGNLRAEPEGDFLVLKFASTLGKRVNTQNANGTTQTGREISCHVCNDVIDGHDARSVLDRRGEQHSWCLTCTTKYSFTCGNSSTQFETGLHYFRDRPGSYVKTDFMVEMENGQIWSKFIFNQKGFTCHKTKKNFDIRHRITVKTPFGLQHWSKESFKGNGWVCFLSSQYFSNEYTPVKLRLPSGITKNVNPDAVKRNSDYTTEDGMVFTLKEKVSHGVPRVSALAAPDEYRNNLKRAIRDFGGIYQTGSTTSDTYTEFDRLWPSYPQYSHIWPDSVWGSLYASTATSGTISGGTTNGPYPVYGDVAVSPSGTIQDRAPVHTEVHTTDGSTTR